MLRSHRRAVVTAAALLASSALLTACQDKADAAAPASDDSHASAPAKDTSADQAQGAGGAQDGKPQAGGVNGTWSGTVTYLAPGKFTVKSGGKPAQAFWVSDKTDIEGTGVICGSAQGQAATPCTEAQLEAAAKKGVSATVTLAKGIATKVVDNNPATGSGPDKPAGPSGQIFGELGYLAPGKYTVKKSDGGPARAFFTSTSTKINGNGVICGENGDNKPCTEAQLEAAAKKGGVGVVVELRKGVAVTIDENHN